MTSSAFIDRILGWRAAPRLSYFADAAGALAVKRRKQVYMERCASCRGVSPRKAVVAAKRFPTIHFPTILQRLTNEMRFCTT